ncbi:MAG: DUF1566 domain-containing protein [Spirochaetales bacterium]|nr:DUF1566 domain-containing protein [Spirochaetales bacterium]
MKQIWNKGLSLLAGAVALSAMACTSNGSAVTNDSASPEEVAAEVTSTGRTYPIVDTNQTLFYGDSSEIEAVQSADQDFYGQDAQYEGLRPSYTVSQDGTTVFDNNTALTWMIGPNTTLETPAKEDKMTFAAAKDYVAEVNAMNYGGYNDWRLPTAKELYSLIQFTGTDPDVMAENTDGLIPFIDDSVFNFAYGEREKRERIIDSQYLSSNVYVSTDPDPDSKLYFGVNFADGRIKGYEAKMPFGDEDKTYFVQLVRGNEQYGINDFEDNTNGTISDKATGLMWTKDDSQTGMAWKEALAWVQEKNEENYLGYSDWRLPNAKELQSLIDYRNGPDYNGKPAIDTEFFNCTPISNEEFQEDYPWYWTGTTHLSPSRDALYAVYIPFGRAMGYEQGWLDVHGAGCQRSDPKSDILSTLTKEDNGYYYSDAPQGDAIRIYNFVRLVRDL